MLHGNLDVISRDPQNSRLDWYACNTLLDPNGALPERALVSSMQVRACTLVWRLTAASSFALQQRSKTWHADSGEKARVDTVGPRRLVKPVARHLILNLMQKRTYCASMVCALRIRRPACVIMAQLPSNQAVEKVRMSAVRAPLERRMPGTKPLKLSLQPSAPLCTRMLPSSR